MLGFVLALRRLVVVFCIAARRVRALPRVRSLRLPEVLVDVPIWVCCGSKYIYIYIYTSLSIYIYIYTYRERDIIYTSLSLSLSLYIYIYIYIYIYNLISGGWPA